jgi:Tol biopolymer transport system component
MATREKRKIFTPPQGMEIRPNGLSWSPDGQWLAFSSYDGNIYVVDRSGQDLTQVSYGGNDYFPAFSKQ